MAHDLVRISLLAVAAAFVAADSAAAQGSNSAVQQLQGIQQQTDKARRNPSPEGAKTQSGRGTDTKGSYAPPVRANSQSKPSPVGQKIYGPGGYKPAATTVRTTPPPSSVVTRPATPPRTSSAPRPTRTSTTPATQPRSNSANSSSTYSAPSRPAASSAPSTTSRPATSSSSSSSSSNSSSSKK